MKKGEEGKKEGLAAVGGIVCLNFGIAREEAWIDERIGGNRRGGHRNK
jgi:hypothetical protein